MYMRVGEVTGIHSVGYAEGISVHSEIKPMAPSRRLLGLSAVIQRDEVYSLP
jgi:hypothetical protein